MSNVEDYQVSFSLEVNVEKAYEDIRKVQTILYRTLSLIRRLGLPEDVEAAIVRLQRLIAVLNTVRLAIIALETASGPYGWAMAGLGLLTTAATVGDFIMESG